EVGVLGQGLRGLYRRNRDEALRVGLTPQVAELYGVAAAQRQLTAAVQHHSPRVEVLVDDQHLVAEVTRPDRGRQPRGAGSDHQYVDLVVPLDLRGLRRALSGDQSEEHTSELQSRENLVCRLLLEKKK